MNNSYLFCAVEFNDMDSVSVAGATPWIKFLEDLRVIISPQVCFAHPARWMVLL